MRLFALLSVLLVVYGCAYLPRSPYCIGAKPYRGLALKDPKKMPANLRKDVQSRSGVTFGAWYESHSAAVVIAVSPGRGERAYNYNRVGSEYQFEGEEAIDCLEE